MSNVETQCPRLVRYFRNLRGGSQPILAAASDGLIYVVKFADNQQGEYLSFNECMGAELYRACGLPVAPWKLLQVADTFLDQNPSCWSETPNGRRKPAPGMCFGSRFLGDGSRLYEILPGSYFQRVTNATDFWFAWLLDVGANHTDNRQAIFREEAFSHLQAVFIDFGHMFGGASGGDPFRSIRQSQYRDARIYSRVSLRFLVTLSKNLDSLVVS
jgi:hypothetical protein